MKLKNFILEKSERVGNQNIPIFGVNNQTGIDTSKDISDNTSNYKIIRKNYFAYNPYRVNIGSIGLFKGEIGGVSPAYMVFSVDENRLNPDFLFVFLKSPLGNIEINKYTFGAVRKSLSLKGLGNIEIPNLSLEEQNVFLENYNKFKVNFDNLSKVTDKTISYIKQLKQAILQEAIEGKLTKSWREQNPGIDPASVLLEKIKAEKEELVKQKKLKKQEKLKEISDDEIPFEIPENWSWCRLGEIVTILGDGLHGTPEYDLNGEYYFINGNNLTDGFIEIKENTKKVTNNQYLKYKKDLNSNTVFVSINGTIGNVAFYNGEKVILGKSACYFNLHDFISKYYIKNIIKTNYFLSYGFSKATGFTIKNLGLKAMNNFPIPLPPLEEQKEIVKKVDEMMKFCDELEKQSLETKESSENLMKSVLSEVFNK